MQSRCRLGRLPFVHHAARGRHRRQVGKSSGLVWKQQDPTASSSSPKVTRGTRPRGTEVGRRQRSEGLHRTQPFQGSFTAAAANFAEPRGSRGARGWRAAEEAAASLQLFAFLQSRSASFCLPALVLSLFPSPLCTYHSSGSCLFIFSNGIRLQVVEQLK